MIDELKERVPIWKRRRASGSAATCPPEGAARRSSGSRREVGSVSVARAVVEERRAELLAGATDEADLVARARARLRPSLRRVLNATGVVVHTNLGRAPLARRRARGRRAGRRGLLEPRVRPRATASAARATTTSRGCCAS